MSKTIEPIAIVRHDGETHPEYLLRLAAAYIRAYAPEQPVHNDSYDDDVNLTGIEFATDLEEHADELRKDREKSGISMELTGTIIQAGNDEETGKPTITIRTSEQQLRSQKSIPFYRPCEIHFTPIPGH